MKLDELLIPDAIQAKLDLSTIDQTIQKAGELLVAAGAVEQRYIQGMKNTLKMVGPYFVIAPGIALLHARPEDGVIKSSLALVTLKRPIPFGHSTNDPVDLVFALAATDKNSHVEALAELAGYLSEEEFLQLLRGSGDTSSLKESIHFYIGKRK
ncbi:MAG TPA: PTS maltose transporter subunit IIBC [Anaerolineaceae bacterium]|nr:PTS maltose transporter subunit IIBC [Anaerolineaceae bacterium]